MTTSVSINWINAVISLLHTWLSAVAKSTAIKDRGTNVFKLFEAIDLNGHRTNPRLTPQVALYDDGVGTESLLPLKIVGGAFGWGLKRNVLKLYTLGAILSPLSSARSAQEALFESSSYRPLTSARQQGSGLRLLLAL